MKYGLLSIIFWCIILVVVCYFGFIPLKGEEIIITQPIKVEKTLDSEIDRLSIKYQVSSSSAIKIIKCESNFMPNAIRVNTTGTIDYSYWQINNYYWAKEMLDMGWDIKVPEDNLEAGFYLYSTYGDSLWNWSKYCWGK